MTDCCHPELAKDPAVHSVYTDWILRYTQNDKLIPENPAFPLDFLHKNTILYPDLFYLCSMTNILKTERSFDAISPNVSPEFWLEQRKKTEKIIDAFCQKREHNANYLHDATTLKEALDDYQQLQGGLGE